jgi:hypothetical protein
MTKLLLTLTIGFVITTIIVLALDNKVSIKAQNITDLGNLSGIENTTASATVTARQNVSPTGLEPEDYPTPGPTDG